MYKRDIEYWSPLGESCPPTTTLMLRPSSWGVHTFSSSTEWSYTQSNVWFHSNNSISCDLQNLWRNTKFTEKPIHFFDSWFQNPGKSSTWFRILSNLWYFSVLVQQTLLTIDILQEPEINHVILGQLNYLWLVKSCSGGREIWSGLTYVHVCGRYSLFIDRPMMII